MKSIFEVRIEFGSRKKVENVEYDTEGFNFEDQINGLLNGFPCLARGSIYEISAWQNALSFC